MSPIRLFALLFGVVFLLVGICGFVPAFLAAPMPGMPDHTDQVVHSFDGRLFGLFHVNAIHSGLHLLFGVLGLAACGRSAAARGYAGLVFLAYAGLAVLGLFPATDTLFGMAPIHGHDVGLHVFLAAAAGLAAVALPRGGKTTVVTTTAVPAPVA